ncbi:MAG: PAS domain-containing protein, partial [Chloroflexota bacterium]|nr:PAS domain-containing protein [Chloroflexota bacterium]
MTEKAKRRIPGTRALGGQMPVFGLILVVVAIAAGALLGILQLYLVANQRSDDLHSLQTIARYAEQLRLYEGKVLATEPDAMDRLATDGSPIRAALDELEARGEIYSIEHLRSRFDAYLTSFAEEERLIANGELGSAVTLHKTWTVPAGLEFRSEVNRQLGIAARAEEQARRIAMVGLVGAMTLAALLVSGLLVAFDRNRRRAIDLLSRQELRFRSLIEYGSDVTLVLEADGRIQFVTPAVEHVFGFRPDKLMGKNLLAMVA